MIHLPGFPMYYHCTSKNMVICGGTCVISIGLQPHIYVDKC